MGRQVNFFLHKEDQLSFDKLLKTWENSVLLRYKTDKAELSILDSSISESGDVSRICLARREDLHEVIMQFIASQNYWLIDSTCSPVIELDRSLCTDESIRRGRLYFQPRYVAEMEWVEKSKDFNDWADNIIRTVRRKLKKYKHQMGRHTYSEYLGEHALRWVQENKAEIKDAGQILTISKK